MLQKLSPEEELEFLKEIHGGTDYGKLFQELKESFSLLQTRAQMLLGLATICLTITGFSGPRMAASNVWSRFFIGFGLTFVLLSVMALVSGPLRLRWIAPATELRANSVTSSKPIARNNLRNQGYNTIF